MIPDRLAAVEKILIALRQNQFQASFAENRGQLMEALRHEIPEGAVVASGSSLTLEELGIRSWLTNGRFSYLDCSAEAENRGINIQKSFGADIYVSSVAAITQQGELFLVDGTGNRTAAFAYGPKRVLVIAGTKKITEDFSAAVTRVREIAAPGTAVRRQKTELPCYILKSCRDCRSRRRMCCNFLKIGFSRDPERFHIYLIDEDVGL